ncbi:hypothetical protein CRM22_010366 [Opisthorchis felineus]|uniref:Noggin n=1 Tax=Opisthorchis felineus TaxID=147828 RepID=A0A4S2KZC5_OPIFE|nr:hypothetical protein CRM22_010366 [Opisthorchis felineus]TGZ55605.1 hypothetical protein CRM22_010366 [Opisthorchis felineus]TGZ55606.1 hypothetical protein CRM22_010366 [Opisthorchis felineus]
MQRPDAARLVWNSLQRQNQQSKSESHAPHHFPTEHMDVLAVKSDGISSKRTRRIPSGHFAQMIQTLTPDLAPTAPVAVPTNVNERPFNQSLILSPREMIRLLDESNYDSKFMTLYRPRNLVHTSGVFFTRHLSKQRLSRLKEWLHLLKYKPSTNRARRETTRTGNRTVGARRERNANRFAAIYKRFRRIAEGHRALVIPRNSNGWLSFLHLNNSTYLPDERRTSPQNLKTRSKRRSRKQKEKIKRSVRKMLRSLLSDYTLCPVYYYWQDFGQTYWPRYIKQGFCVNFGGTSCSIPPGLFCKEAEFTDVTVLRYFCLVHWPQEKCKWYRTRLPVLTSCRCGCVHRIL